MANLAPMAHLGWQRARRSHSTCGASPPRAPGGSIYPTCPPLRVANRRKLRSIRHGPDSCRRGERSCAALGGRSARRSPILACFSGHIWSVMEVSLDEYGRFCPARRYWRGGLCHDALERGSSGARGIGRGRRSARETLSYLLVAAVWICEAAGLRSRGGAGSYARLL